MSSIHEAARLKMEAAVQGEEEAVEEPVSEEAPEEDGGGGDGESVPEAANDGTAEATEEAGPSTEPDEEGAEAAADAAEEALAEDATEEEIEEAREQAREEFFVGTYRTREDAEKGLAEKDRVTEELFTTVNELRQQLATQETRAEEPEEIDLPAWDRWAQEQVEAGAGEAAALQALENGGYAGYEVLMKHWVASEDPQDRANAIVFNNGMIMEIASARAQYAAQQTVGQPSDKELTQQAHDQVKARYPDLDDHTAAMAEVVTGLPAEDAQWLRDLAQEGVEGRARALRMVYLEAVQRGGPPKPETPKAERTRRKVSEDHATVDATTSSSEGTAGTRTAPPATEAYALERKRGLRERQSLPPLEE